MSPVRLGLVYCLSFVTLEAVQVVYLGHVFQRTDSFLIGTLVFGFAVVFALGTTAAVRPDQLRAAAAAPGMVIRLNLYAALTWSTYFIAVQMIEPAVVFTVFSGMVPLATLVAGWRGMREAIRRRHPAILTGNLLIVTSIGYLAATTTLGLSGFVRGAAVEAVAGVLLAALSGTFTAFVILYSVRLNKRGVGPLAQFGLRFVLYTMLAFLAFLAGLDDKGAATPTGDLLEIVVIGFAVIALPLYLVQKAIPLVHASTIAIMTALGPAIVFLLQMFDERIAYAPATLAGLVLYIVGASIAALAAMRQDSTRVLSSRTPG